MEPTSKFEDKSKDVRLEKFVINASGMILEKLLLFKERYCKFWRRKERQGTYKGS